MSTFLITGDAGFIGYSLSRRLLEDGHTVVGIDAMTDYYDVLLKRDRLAHLREHIGFTHHEIELENEAGLIEIAVSSQPDYIVHLAAQAGVRYSIENPHAYLSANVIGTYSVLAAAAASRPRHLLTASTSSAYGGNVEMPFAETSRTGSPMSLYAATKIAGEALAHSNAHLNNVPTTSFRFFTVYGPWGRPDMALFKFVNAIRSGEPIDIYGQGAMQRDFTYIDDLVESIVRLIPHPPVAAVKVDESDSISPVAPYRVVNIGGGAPSALMEFVDAIEDALGTQAVKNYLPMQPGDVVATHADPTLLHALVGAQPITPLREGVRRFVQWYEAYFDARNASVSALSKQS